MMEKVKIRDSRRKVGIRRIEKAFKTLLQARENGEILGVELYEDIGGIHVREPLDIVRLFGVKFDVVRVKDDDYYFEARSHGVRWFALATLEDVNEVQEELRNGLI